MATLTYIGPPSPGWADPDHRDPDDPDAHWVNDRGVDVQLPGLSALNRRNVKAGESLEIPDSWLDPDSDDFRAFQPTLWRVSGGPADTRKVGELRDALTARGLPAEGKRDELLARLQAAEAADPDGVQLKPVRNLGSPDNPGDFGDPAEQAPPDTDGTEDAPPVRRSDDAEGDA